MLFRGKTGLVAGLFVLILTGHANAAIGAPALSEGSRGADVSTLQTELKTLGFYTYPNITGYFGPVTKDAVLRFQNAYHLVADGIVGPQTAFALHEALGRRIVASGEKYKGTPYQWGGESPSGFDCSGFVQYVMAENQVRVPRAVSTMYETGTPVRRDALRVGDLVFFNTDGTGPSHVGIYAGNGMFLHASTSQGVTMSSLGNAYWSPRYIGARDVF
jgi:peptidoglycan hydrolase-like protein with peptidoglycan-binding domain